MRSSKSDLALPRPTVEWKPFERGALEKYLRLSVPPFTSRNEAFRQLRYVEEYAGDLKCRALAIESHYIDRDHIEDHSVFYSKSLFPYVNYCQRVHFFSVDVKEGRQRLNAIVQTGIRKQEQEYRDECKQFSEDAYLGFAVIKPLHGSPVGRTVLRHFPETPEESDRREPFRRNFNGTRLYNAHFSGVELEVQGLAFQQQDVGVAACATIAIWSALQKTSDHEDIAAATPAQITSLAAKYSLPYGRSMPSEGLSVDQMCQAVQSLGLAPNLFRVDEDKVARAYLHSAIRSGFAPVLILSGPRGRHAVTVVGMKVRLKRKFAPVVKDMNDASNDMMGLYIHDDRRGPYLRTDLVRRTAKWRNPDTNRLEQKDLLHLVIPPRAEVATSEKAETWAITHILIPMHAKIRLSFSGLSYVHMQAAKTALRYRETFRIPAAEFLDTPISVDTWIARAHKYVESLFIGRHNASPARIKKLVSTISLARYVGIVRLSAPHFDLIDIVVDTTNTKRNVHCLGVVVVDSTRNHTSLMARYLAATLGCDAIE